MRFHLSNEMEGVLGQNVAWWRGEWVPPRGHAQLLSASPAGAPLPLVGVSSCLPSPAPQLPPLHNTSGGR